MQINMVEKWIIINGEPNYEVSNLGQVRNKTTGKILAQNKTSTSQRWYVKIHQKNYNVARLVAIAFVPLIEGKEYVNHIDGDKLNNRADNLEWVSRSENEKHAFANGLKTPTRGECSGMAKATQEQVDYIRSVYVAGSKDFSIRALAKKTGLSKSTIQAITSGKTWK